VVTGSSLTPSPGAVRDFGLLRGPSGGGGGHVAGAARAKSARFFSEDQIGGNVYVTENSNEIEGNGVGKNGLIWTEENT
jgi:hypothetical protein